MNFGDALRALLNGSFITRTGWNRQGMALGLQPPTGKITEPFLFRRIANGECTAYNPDAADILATDWNVANAGQREGVEEAEKQHAGAGR
jgi:hypothetical protein